AAPGQAAEPALAGTNATSAVARLRYDVGAGSSLGVLATFRGLPDRENVVASADGRFQLGTGTVLTAQGVGTWSAEGAAASHDGGVGYRVRVLRKSRHLAVTLNADGRSPG